MEFFCDNKRHLICLPYSIDNLHIMAHKLGISKGFFHSKTRNRSHYDIPVKRIIEIQNKCTIVTDRDIINILNNENNRIK